MEQAQEIDLQLCYPAWRARPIDDAAVKALAKSIDENGLLNPIIVRKAQKSRAGRTCDAFEVIAGMHRVKAFRRLKRATIPAYVREIDDLHAELMVIDENLSRDDLPPAERASALARRKKIYLLHPETRPASEGGERRRKQTRRKFGDASEDALAKVAGTSLDKGEEMDALTELSSKKRDELIKRAIDLKVCNIGLSGIACLPQRRAVRADLVEALARSMGDVGLLNPITLRPREGGIGYYLIAGRHRYEGARKLKWDAIPAIVLDDLDAVDAELCEIDENLIRADLSPAEQAAHHARRKELYQQKHPLTKRGAAGGAATKAKSEGAKAQNEPQPSYADTAAAETKTSRATVKRAVKRGEAIPHIADLAGTSLDKGAELDALAKLAPERQSEVIEKAKAGEKISAKAELKKDARAAREADLGEKIAAGNLALPAKRYGIILADWPRKPWAYSDETGVDRSPANHYPVQDLVWAIDVLAPMISKLAAPDCMLAFWSTAASLIDDIEIMAEAGFIALRLRDSDGRLLRDVRGLLDPPVGGTYRSHLIWDKQAIGKGRWFRDRHELLLIGARGKFPAPAPGTQSHSIFSDRKAEHSTKPDFVAAEIERLWPNIPKIEMFRRGPPRPGWDAWGSDALLKEAAE